MNLLHASDLHLRADSGSPEARHRLEVFQELCSLARGADALILAGDLFDSFADARDAGLLARVRQGLAGLASVVIIPGNHEFLRGHGKNPFDPLPDLGPNARLAVRLPCEIFRLGAVDFLAFPFQAGASTAELFRGLLPAEPGRRRVAVLHGTAADRPGLAMYAYAQEEEGGDLIIRDQDLAGAGLSYAALGHIHRRDDWQLPRGGRAAYPGSTSAIRHTEQGARGYNSVSLDEKTGEARVCWQELKTAAGAEREDFFVAPGEEAAVISEIRAFFRRLPAMRLPYASVTGLGSRKALEDGKRGLEAEFAGAFKLPPRIALESDDDDSDPAASARLLRDFLAAMRTRGRAAPPGDRPALARALVLGWWALLGRERDIKRLLERLAEAAP